MGTLATNSPADLILDYLAAQVTLDFTGWGTFVGELPDKPDKAIAFMDTGGPGGIPNLLVDYPTVQVLLRGSSAGGGYVDAYKMANAIRTHLIGMNNSPPEFVELDGITEQGYMMPLGRDDSQRPLFSNNFRLTVEPLTSPGSNRMSL